MKDMNPLRNDEVAAQERIIQLERELAEKNKLIYKLQNPTPKKQKQPRKPINWSRLSTKSVKIILACACVGGLVYACEPNSLYTSDGFITYVGKVQTQTICNGPKKIGFGRSKVETQRTGCHTYSGYDVKASFLDINGKMRETFAEAFEEDEWVINDRLKSMNVNFSNKRIIYPKNINHLKKGCKIQVYFLRGALLGTRPWLQDPKIDASMCGE